MAKNIAVIGTGVMGRNHVRTLAESPEDVHLSYLIDSDLGSAQKTADMFGGDAIVVAGSLDEIDADNVDAAIIASPSHLHTEQAVQLMEAGIHVLVEKPIALSVADAEHMRDVARSTGRVLMVGHVELFNPVVQDLRQLLEGEQLRTVRFQRLGAVNDQSRLKHEVVNDLMLHDISIANQLIDIDDETVPEVVAAYGRRDTVASPDPAEAIIDYGNGIDAYFRASRAYAGGKVRSIEAEAENSVFIADLLTKQITKRSAGEGVITARGRLIQDIRTSLISTQEAREALLLEQLHFLKSIDGECTPEEANVSVDDAIRILKLTDAILSKMTFVK